MLKEEKGLTLGSCMSGNDFELWVRCLLRKVDFYAESTGGEDNGVDIVATITEGGCELKYHIQCKFYNKPVAKAPIQEVFAGNYYRGNDGHPVVITNNYITQSAKEYAAALGVETITKIELDELSQLAHGKEVINDSHSGLMGILVGKVAKREDLVQKTVLSYDKEAIRDTCKTDKEELIDKIQGDRDEINRLIEQASELHEKEIACMNKAFSLQTETILKSLQCL